MFKIHVLVLSGALLLGQVNARAATSVQPVKPVAKSALKPQTLAKVSSDRDANVSRLVAIVDEKGAIQSVRFDTKNMSEGSTTTLKFDVKQMASSQGVVLVEASGYNAVILKASIDSPNGLGRVTVRFLTDAFANNYSSCKAAIVRSPEGKWQLINARSKKPVSELFVQSHATGITTIKGICD